MCLSIACVFQHLAELEPQIANQEIAACFQPAEKTTHFENCTDYPSL